MMGGIYAQIWPFPIRGPEGDTSAGRLGGSGDGPPRRGCMDVSWVRSDDRAITLAFMILGKVSNHEVTSKCVYGGGGGTVSLASPEGGGLTARPHLTSPSCTFPGSDPVHVLSACPQVHHRPAPISRQPLPGPGEVRGFAPARCTEVAAAREGEGRRRPEAQPWWARSAQRGGGAERARGGGGGGGGASAPLDQGARPPPPPPSSGERQE